MTKLKTKLHLWKEHISVGVIILAAVIITNILVYNRIEEIPRSALLEFSNLLATLLGLTFTAFAILVSITPMIRKDFLKTDIFDSIGVIFYVTLILQFFSLIFTFMSYILFGHNIYYVFINIVAISLAVWSLGFLLYSIRYLFLIFRSTKNKILEKDQTSSL
jgi:hypothetical protein